MAGLSLSIPLKISTEYDYSASLANQFHKSPELDSAVNELNKLRNILVNKNTSKSQATLESLYRYYDQLVALSKKIPKSTHNQMISPFTWQDAIDKGNLFAEKPTTASSNIDFEKICTLFNIAALQSRLGSECSDTDEDLKTAAKLFQSSAGIFNDLSALKIQMMLKDGQALTSDLSEDTLSSLSALMLAQAQETFVTKAIRGQMKDALIAKLSVQAVDLFADALSKMTKNSVKHLWDKTWLPNVAGKRTGYEALSNFFQSQVCAVNKRVGEQISHLELCLKYLRKAQDKIGNSEFLAYYVNEGTRLKAEAQKDNDFIYHEPVPDSANLPTIARVPTARLAKLLPVPESFSTSFVDLFEKCSLNTSPSASCTLIAPQSDVVNQAPSNTPTQNTGIAEPPVKSTVPPPRPPPPTTPNQKSEIEEPPVKRSTAPEPSPSPSSPSNAPADPASPTLTDILNTSVDAVGNYLHNYLFGRRRQQ